MSCHCIIKDLGVFNAQYLFHSCPLGGKNQSRFLDMFCVIIIIVILDHADVLMCMSYVSCVVTVEESQNLYIFSIYRFSFIFNGSRLLFIITCMVP